MNDPRDFKLDLSGIQNSNQEPSKLNAPPDRLFLSVLFDCCKVYQRIYRDPDGKQYHGRCPKCGLVVKFVVGEGGSDARSFIVS